MAGQLPELEPIDLLLFSVFIGHGYLQHSGEEYHGYRNMRYHVYLVPVTVPVLDVICYSCSDSLETFKGDVVVETEDYNKEKVIEGISIRSE